MKEPSPSTIKRLFALSNNRCAFPRCISPIITPSGSLIGKICHINARSEGGPRYDANQTDEERHGFANLILLCGTHHDVIDNKPKIYTADILREMKQNHEQKGRIEIQPEDTIFAGILLNDYRQVQISNNTGFILVNSPGAIQAKTVNLNTVKKSVKVMPPNGTISTDLQMIGYAKHLVKRYHEFAGGDTTRKSTFSYAAMYKNIEKKFGVKMDFIPIGRFNELVDYLQKRIVKTRQACINKGRGHKAYSSFEEYCEKYKV